MVAQYGIICAFVRVGNCEKRSGRVVSGSALCVLRRGCQRK